MSSKVRIALVVCLAASLAGCGQNTPDDPPAGSSVSAAPSASASHPSVIRSLRPVAKLTSACALLSAAELKALLGGSSSRTKVTATEDKPDKESYTCEYGSGGKKPFALIVDSSDVRTFTPKDAVDAAAKVSHVKTQRVKGVGAAAVFNVTKDGYGVISASKRSHGQTRSVFFSAPRVVPERKFAEVARLVISRM
jgi:predicted small lipoprotein YifL